MNSRRKPFFGLAAVIFTIALFLLVPSLVGAWDNQWNKNLVVKTDYGKLQGSLSSDRTTMLWKGVPYAEPPVGNLRWKASQDPQPWHGVRKAIDPAKKCTQLQTNDDWIRSGIVDPDSSEDCLYVDIYRPNHAGILPVYVWIHGGSNNFGSAREYPAADLAVRSDVVVVVVQYRLGPMGWFYHPALQKGVDPYSASGNFGTLDHAQALRWIRQNIDAFGGDRRNVIVTGESAGAHNTMNLVISPVGKGLFNRAMYESGGMAPVTADSGRTAANGYIEKLIRLKEGVDAATATARRIAMEDDGTLESYLRSKDAGDLFLAIYNYSNKSLPTFPIIMDGKVMPLGGWIPAIQSGNYNKMPIILGSNEYELKSFMPLYYKYMIPYVPSTYLTNGYSWLDLFLLVRNQSSLTLEQVLLTQFDKDLYDRAGYFGSRQWKAKNVDSIAHELAKVQDDVYAYLFKWGGVGSGPYPFDHIYGAGHAAEIAFFGIGADKGLFNLPFVPDNEKGREKLKTAMMSYLSNFVRTGNPNYPFFFPPWGKWWWCNQSRLPIWKEWSNAPLDPKAIIFDADFNHAKITMMNEEVTFASAEAERKAWVDTQGGTNSLADNVTKAFLWQPPW